MTTAQRTLLAEIDGLREQIEKQHFLNAHFRAFEISHNAWLEHIRLNAVHGSRRGNSPGGAVLDDERDDRLANKMVDAKPPPLTYSRRTLENGDTVIVLRSFTHKRGCGHLYISPFDTVSICSFEYPDWYGHTPQKTLRVTGRSATQDNRPILIPAADWPTVEAALRDYGAVEVQA